VATATGSNLREDHPTSKAHLVPSCVVASTLTDNLARVAHVTTSTLMVPRGA
jgi:hypothetical protein